MRLGWIEGVSVRVYEYSLLLFNRTWGETRRNPIDRRKDNTERSKQC